MNQFVLGIALPVTKTFNVEATPGMNVDFILSF